VRRGLERIFRLDSARQTASLFADADRGPERLEADPAVAGSSGGGAARGIGRTASNQPAEAGNTAGRSDFAPAGQPVSALVRQGVSPGERSGPLGQGQTGALRRRLCGAGAAADAATGGMDRDEAGILDGAGDQSGEDAGPQAEAARSES